MKGVLFLRCFASHGCCSFALSITMLLAAPAVAQDTPPAEQEIFGFYLSGPGLIDNITLSGLYSGANIESLKTISAPLI